MVILITGTLHKRRVKTIREKYENLPIGFRNKTGSGDKDE